MKFIIRTLPKIGHSQTAYLSIAASERVTDNPGAPFPTAQIALPENPTAAPPLTTSALSSVGNPDLLLPEI